MTSASNLNAESSPTLGQRNLELESIDFFVRLMSMLGMPGPWAKYMDCSIFPWIPYPWTKSHQDLASASVPQVKAYERFDPSKPCAPPTSPATGEITTLRKQNSEDCSRTLSKTRSCLIWKVQKIGFPKWKNLHLRSHPKTVYSTRFALKS